LKASDFPSQDVRIVIADDSEATKRITEGLQKRFPSAQIVAEITASQSKRRNQVYVTVGPAALRAVLTKEIEVPILSLFTSSQAYRSILESAPKHAGGITAIFAEPSLFDQMQLIASVYKQRVSVAVLLTDKTSYLAAGLRQAASMANLDLDIEEIGADDNVNRALNRIRQAPVILAVPDTSIYNAENIRNILVTSYRHNQSVVGFSSALVKAGALASTISSIEDIIVQAEELLSEFASSGRLSVPQFPKYFSVTFNENVARSLNLSIDDNTKRMARKPSGRVS